MNNHDYEKARQECWDALYNELLKGEVQWQPVSRKEIFNYAFDRAYALGKEKETITQEEIEKAWQDYAQEIGLPDSLYYVTSPMIEIAIKQAFKAGTKVIGKQEKDAGKKTALTDKEMYALESAISELESLMDGTLDEDYHKEQTSIVNALKRIIKKYEKK